MTLADRINTTARRVPAGAVYLAGLLPLAWLVGAAATGSLGIDPVKEMEHRLGLWALQLLVAGLCITPLRRFAGVNLIRFRRAIGLVAFSYVALHLAVWLVLDMGLLWDQALKDIAKRPYVTMGMAGFAALVPLALTSNDAALRRMGAAAWRRLHRLTYFAVLAGGVHYLWLVKAWPLEPILYLAAILALLGLRALPRRSLAAR